MTIMPAVTITEIKGGVAAQAVELRMACHGRDRGRAIASLASMVATWARCVALDGELDRTLARLGIKYVTDDAEPGVRIDLSDVTG